MSCMSCFVGSKHRVKTKVIAVNFSTDWEPYDVIRPELASLDIGILGELIIDIRLYSYGIVFADRFISNITIIY